MILFFALFLTFISGCFVAGSALHDPDTCWQLALGKLIFESSEIVRIDPFSYTFSAIGAGHDFVMYQWLSNLIFYLTYKDAGLFGLLLLAAEIIVFSFIVLPLIRAQSRTLLDWDVLLVVVIGTLTASFHFLVRPEIWSYLFLAVCVVIACRIERSNKNKARIDWRAIAAVFLTMLFWCNLHSGFVLGLLLFVIQAVCELAINRRLKPTVALALGAGLIASLINPYGIQLWSYLPHLFFPLFNKYIVEIKPLGLTDLTTLTFVPYVLLSLITLYRISRLIQFQDIKSLCFPIATALICIGAGIASRRLVPFSAIVQTMFMIELLQTTRAPKRPLRMHVIAMALLMAASVIAGVYWISTFKTIDIAIPQSSIVFHSPTKAIEHLKTSLPEGNLLNDPQFGDVMIWHMSPCPKLFIDTRFDMYGWQIVEDYHQMSECKGNFQTKLADYNIRWIFMRPQQKLVSYLRQSPNWKTVYEDDTAVVLARQTN